MMFSDFFLDPLYRAPFIGSMLMCLASALMGTLMLVKRRSLLGEALSHSTYPGVVISAMVGALFFNPNDLSSVFIILGGAFLFAYLGLQVIEKLRSRFRIHLDAALCLTLSVFWGSEWYLQVGFNLAIHFGISSRRFLSMDKQRR